MPIITATANALDALPTIAPSFGTSNPQQSAPNLFANLLAQQITTTSPATTAAGSQPIPLSPDQLNETERHSDEDGSGELIAGALLFVPLTITENPTPLPPVATITNPLSQIPTPSGNDVETPVSVNSVRTTPNQSNGLMVTVVNKSISTYDSFVELPADPTRTTNTPVDAADRPPVTHRSIPLPPPAEQKVEKTVRTANGPPSIVLQTPIAMDRSLAPPANPVAISSDPFRLPLTEPAAVSGTLPVTSDTTSAMQSALRGGVSFSSSGEPTASSVPVGFQYVLDAAESPRTPTPEPGWNPATSVPLTNTPSQPAWSRSIDTAPQLSSQLADGIVTHARVVEHGNTHEFHLRLDPAELGEVRVRLLSTGDRVQAEVTVLSDAVRGMIESQLPELKQRLEAAGLTVSKFDVNTQTSGGGSSPHRTPNQTNAWESPSGGIFPRVTPTRSQTAPTSVLVGGTLDVTA